MEIVFYQKVIIGQSESLLFSSAGQEILALNDRNQANILSEMLIQIKADRNIQMESNGRVTIGAGTYMHIKQRGTINEIIHRAVRHDYPSGCGRKPFEERVL